MKAKIMSVIAMLGARVRAAGFNIYVALNMLVASIIFAGFAKPRETISGFVGRRGLLGSNVFLFLAMQIDKLYRDPGHCGSTAQQEDEARFALYPREYTQETAANYMRDNQ